MRKVISVILTLFQPHCLVVLQHVREQYASLQPVITSLLQ